jgi:hypothetical protein
MLAGDVGVLRAEDVSPSRGLNRYRSGCSESASARPMTEDPIVRSFPATSS